MNAINSYKKWTDEEIEMVLSHAPLPYNCERMARLLKRSYGSVVWVYRIGMTPKKKLIELGQYNNIFVRDPQQ